MCQERLPTLLPPTTDRRWSRTERRTLSRPDGATWAGIAVGIRAAFAHLSHYLSVPSKVSVEWRGVF